MSQLTAPACESTFPNKKEPRYLFVDGLRGIAALAVVFHHLLHSTVLEAALRKILPNPVQAFCHFGAFGVQIFFVISGFVIAHSLRATTISVSTSANFVLRRQLRLDPSYWAILLLSLLLAQVERMIPGLASEPLPGLKTVLLNVVYLQNITGAEQIVGVAWTLCLEVQFYLLMIGLLILGRCLSPRTGAGFPGLSVVFIFVTGATSLVLSQHQKVYGAWMPPFWSYFAAGAICKWSLERKGRQAVFFGFAGLFAITTIWQGTPAMITGLVTVLSLYTVGKMGHLSDWLGSAPFQYFGRISYSLYLIHLPVLSVIMRAGYKITGTTPWAALGWFLLAASVAVVAAHLLYLAVEHPAMLFAARFKEPPTEPAPGALSTLGDNRVPGARTVGATSR